MGSILSITLFITESYWVYQEATLVRVDTILTTIRVQNFLMATNGIFEIFLK